jgi:hypothetical protein
VQLTNVHLEKSQGAIQKKGIATSPLVASQPRTNINALTGKVVKGSLYGQPLQGQPLSGQYIAPIQSSMQNLSLTHQSTQSQLTYSQPMLGKLMQDQHPGKITHGNLYGPPFKVNQH